MCPGRECGALPNELIYPGSQHWMWQIPVPRLKLWTRSGSPRDLSALWIDLDKAGDLVPERLNYRGTVRLVLDQL